MFLTIKYLRWEGDEEDEDDDGRYVEDELDLNPAHIETMYRSAENRKHTIIAMASGDSFTVPLPVGRMRTLIKDFLAESLLQKVYNNQKKSN